MHDNRHGQTAINAYLLLKEYAEKSTHKSSQLKHLTKLAYD